VRGGLCYHGGMFDTRPARPEDRDALYRICLETGDSGQDATALYRDPELIGHIWAGPYLALEPALAFVLQDGAGVCGYVIGALDSADFEARLERQWWPELRARYPDPVNIPAAERTPDQRLTHLIHHPNRTPAKVQERYPSHLHIDLLPRGQGGGNGRRLIQTLLDALQAQGSGGVHLGVGARNERAIGFYEHVGFTELERDAYSRTFGMRL
jgi:ribosomal protein S18 acetylase RimI-like enzyme